METPINRAPLFAALDIEAAAALRTSMTEVRARKGEVIFDDAKLVELIPLAEAALLPSDPKRGEAIFLKHPTAACVLCHALKGVGSSVGPALDGIASRQNAAYIRQSILEPNAVLAKGFES